MCLSFGPLCPRPDAASCCDQQVMLSCTACWPEAEEGLALLWS